MSKIFIAIVSTLVALYVSGCTWTHQETMTEDFGNAVKTNTALQVINPEAGQEDLPPMALDGKKAEQGLKAYQSETGEAETGRLIEDVGN